MIKRQILAFLARFGLSIFGMWVCITLFGTIIGEYDFRLFIAAGLIFAIVNTVVRPLVTLFSLPLIVLTMGLFTFLVNVAMISISVWILPNVEMSFLNATLASIVMSAINGLVNLAFSPYNIK